MFCQRSKHRLTPSHSLAQTGREQNRHTPRKRHTSVMKFTWLENAANGFRKRLTQPHKERDSHSKRDKRDRQTDTHTDTQTQTDTQINKIILSGLGIVKRTQLSLFVVRGALWRDSIGFCLLHNNGTGGLSFTLATESVRSETEFAHVPTPATCYLKDPLVQGQSLPVPWKGFSRLANTYYHMKSQLGMVDMKSQLDRRIITTRNLNS